MINNLVFSKFKVENSVKNHATTVVVYGYDVIDIYWIFRNSLGSTWGKRLLASEDQLKKDK